MMHPKITIITPTFNTGETIETALLSVANQTYKNIEHIIVDGASKDKTVPTIRKYQKKYKNIRLLTEKDSGIYHAMNKGMDIATGDWLYFMGADDTFYNNRVLTELFEEGLFQEEQVVYGNVIIKGDAPWAKDNSIYDGPFTLEKLFRWNICHQSILYPRSIIKKVGYYETKYKVTSDWDYNVRCWAKYKFTYVDKIIAFFTTGGKSSEAGDYSLYLDFPENVIKYFQLDLQDSNLYHATSEFYYPIARHKENEYINTIHELNAETERLNQHIAAQLKEHSELVVAIQNQNDVSAAALKSEFDETSTKVRSEQEAVFATFKEEHDTTINNLKDEHKQNISSLKEEHEQGMTNLKTEYEQAINYLKEEQQHGLINMKNEYDQAIANIQEEHEHLVNVLKKEHDQAITSLKEDQDKLVTNLKTEHTLIVSGLKEEHVQSLAELDSEHNQIVSNLKAEYVLAVAKLKSDHLDSIGTLKNGFEEMINSLKAEQLESLELFRQKEAEFIQVIDLNNEHIVQLDLTIAGKERLFRETVEKYSLEMEKLKAEISANNRDIARIYSSYTWKTGKFLIAPAKFIAKTIGFKNR